LTRFVTPAKAGVQVQPRNKSLIGNRIPAFAGMTTEADASVESQAPPVGPLVLRSWSPRDQQVFS